MTFVVGLTVVVMCLSSLFCHCLLGEGTGVNKGKGSIKSFDLPDIVSLVAFIITAPFPAIMQSA